jgi:glycosyltransferase involved in cell wall biosynthesis
MYAPHVAVEALAQVSREFPEATLTMIGPDRQDGSFERTVNLARQVGVLERISFIPGVPKAEVAARLKQGDIFLNTSTVDNTPVSVIEAMSGGLCVVSTDVGGLRHLLADGRDSLVVSPNDGSAMATAITRILTDQGLAARLSQNALEKAKNFDWKVVLPRWQRLLAAAACSGEARL